MDKRFGRALVIAEFIKLDPENYTQENLQSAIDMAARLKPDPDTVEKFLLLADALEKCDTSDLDALIEMPLGWSATLNPEPE